MVTKSIHILLIAVIALLGLGVVMLSSTHAFNSEEQIILDLKRQGIWIGLGTLIICVVGFTDYRTLKRLVWPSFLLCVVLLTLCFLPHIGVTRNGSSRWIQIFGFQFQPSEMARVVTVFMLAVWYTQRTGEERSFRVGFAYPLLFASSAILLILLEVDIGNASLLTMTTLIVMFMAGVRLRYMLTILCASIAGVALIIRAIPNRMERFSAFLLKDQFLDTWNLQQHRASLAFGSGGWLGRGLGDSRMKNDYIPEANTDFIFPTIGEEFGLVATLGITLSFAMIAICGICVAAHASDRFGKLLGYGLTCMITLQALINMGVTTWILPNKGLPLPFVSYGGSNLLSCCFVVGILISIYRHGKLNFAPEGLALKRPKRSISW